MFNLVIHRSDRLSNSAVILGPLPNHRAKRNVKTACSNTVPSSAIRAKFLMIKFQCLP
jgi:hypothetical protein